MNDLNQDQVKEKLSAYHLQEWAAYDQVPDHDFPEGFEKRIYARALEETGKKARIKKRGPLLALAAVLVFFFIGGAFSRYKNRVYSGQIPNPGLYYQLQFKVPEAFQLVRSRSNEDEVDLHYMDRDFHYIIFERSLREKEAWLPSGPKSYQDYEERGIRWHDHLYDYRVYSNLDKEGFEKLLESNDFIGQFKH